MTTVLDDRTVTTRKIHRCWGCGDKYEVGTIMHVFVSKDGGNLVRTYWCQRCEDFIKHSSLDTQLDVANGIAFGDLREYDTYSVEASQ